MWWRRHERCARSVRTNNEVDGWQGRLNTTAPAAASPFQFSSSRYRANCCRKATLSRRQLQPGRCVEASVARHPASRRRLQCPRCCKLCRTLASNGTPRFQTSIPDCLFPQSRRKSQDFVSCRGLAVAELRCSLLIIKRLNCKCNNFCYT